MKKKAITILKVGLRLIVYPTLSGCGFGRPASSMTEQEIAQKYFEKAAEINYDDQGHVISIRCAKYGTVVHELLSIGRTDAEPPCNFKGPIPRRSAGYSTEAVGSSGDRRAARDWPTGQVEGFASGKHRFDGYAAGDWPIDQPDHLELGPQQLDHLAI